MNCEISDILKFNQCKFSSADEHMNNDISVHILIYRLRHIVLSELSYKLQSSIVTDFSMS